MKETAYAKINLALHVRRRREDGYHEIETLFAFCEHGDTLSACVSPDGQDVLHTQGAFADAIGVPFGNLAMRALTALPRPVPMAVTLEKSLPVAAGLGGGSADAGAVFRLVERDYGLPDDWRTRAAGLGADVPACVRSEMAIGRGVGEELEPVDNDLAGTPVLLINPGVAVSTGPVFAAWDGEDHGPLAAGAASKIAREGRNGLEAPAVSICPAIADTLAALRDTAPRLARMSGSGATCFALYDSAHARDEAAREVAERHPDWWQMATALR